MSPAARFHRARVYLAALGVAVLAANVVLVVLFSTTNVRMVDLAAIVCPTYPCPTVMDGVLIRPGGGHYTPESSVWVAQRLVPQALAAFPHLRPGAG